MPQAIYFLMDFWGKPGNTMTEVTLNTLPENSRVLRMMKKTILLIGAFLFAPDRPSMDSCTYLRLIVSVGCSEWCPFSIKRVFECRVLACRKLDAPKCRIHRLMLYVGLGFKWGKVSYEIGELERLPNPILQRKWVPWVIQQTEQDQRWHRF